MILFHKIRKGDLLSISPRLKMAELRSSRFESRVISERSLVGFLGQQQQQQPHHEQDEEEDFGKAGKDGGPYP